MSLFWNKQAFLILAALAGAAGILTRSPLALVLATALVVFALQKLPDAPALPSLDTHSAAFLGLGSIGLLVAGIAAWSSLQHNYRLDTFDAVLWLVSILLISGTAIWHDSHYRLAKDESLAAASRQSLYLDVGIIAVTLLVALALRLYDLAALPLVVHGDEGEVGMLALRVLGAGEPLPIFATTDFGHNPAGFPYLLAPLIALFGRNETGLRMLSVLFGAVSAPLIYLIGRRGWGVLAGAAAAWLIAVSHFYIHYSRIAVPNIANAFFMVLLVWSLIRAYQRNLRFLERSPVPAAGARGTVQTRWGVLRLDIPVADFVAVGLVIGFSQYFYHGSRLLLLLAGFAFVYLLFLRKATVLQILITCVAALIVTAPLGAFFLSHWEEFVGRSGTVFIFSEANLKQAMGVDATFAHDLLPYLWHQFTTTLGFLTGDGDRSSFYMADIPAFDPVSLLLLWLGFGVVLTRIRRFEESLTAAWFLLGMVFAGFLTTEQPNGPLLVSVAPACYLIIGILIQRVWSLLPGLARRQNRWLAAGLLGSLALVLLYLNWHTYFVELKGYTHSIIPTAAARAVAQAPASASVYLMGDPIVYTSHGTIRFLAPRDQIADLKTADALPAPGTDDPGTFILAVEPRLGDLQTIVDRYPGGQYESFTDPWGHFLFASYYLP